MRLQGDSRPLASAFAKVGRQRVAPMRLALQGAQTAFCAWNRDQVDMIVHQAPGESDDIPGRTFRRHQRQIRPPILVAKDNRQAAVAALGHMVRCLRDHDAGEAGHQPAIAVQPQQVTLLYCP